MTDLLFSLPGLAAILTVFCAGAIQGATGFGFNMLAAPLLAIIDPAFVPGAMLLMATAVCIGGAIQERQALRVDDVGVVAAHGHVHHRGEHDRRQQARARHQHQHPGAQRLHRSSVNR